uniref:DUF222 domain-containing protein n=1 Tax=Steinernema glaseri TaxID=37863 RepID=A0A1I7YME4_9BILA
VEVSVPELERRRDASVNALAILLGEPPQRFTPPAAEPGDQALALRTIAVGAGLHRCGHRKPRRDEWRGRVVELYRPDDSLVAAGHRACTCPHCRQRGTRQGGVDRVRPDGIARVAGNR